MTQALIIYGLIGTFHNSKVLRETLKASGPTMVVSSSRLVQSWSTRLHCGCDFAFGEFPEDAGVLSPVFGWP